MLKLRGVCKSYYEGSNKRVVIDNVCLDFKKREMVFILGKSGSGKTTLLNIIGGNLRCDRGKIYLDKELVSEFNDCMMSDYRGSVVGNVFQDYNLIEYMNVYDNVNLFLKNGNNRDKILMILKQLGLYEKRGVLVNKLSGGECQRVAIARAMIKDPKILICDEPTGAMDSENSELIMDILKRISLNRLVIVVSHDRELANKYADRIIYLKDGKVDYIPQDSLENIGEVEKVKIGNGMIRKMARKNLWLRKKRTILSSLAISLGLISMILVVLLFSNFNKELSDFEEEMVGIVPVSISNGNYVVNGKVDSDSSGDIVVKKREDYIYENKITNEDIEFLEGIEEIKNIEYDYLISMPILSDKYEFVDSGYFSLLDNNIKNNYRVVCGRMPENEFEIVLKVDNDNGVYDSILKPFKIDSDVTYESIIGRKVRVVLNDLYYVLEDGYFYPGNDYRKMYDESEIELVVVGVIQSKDSDVLDDSLFYYDGNLVDRIISGNRDSLIVKSQILSDRSLLVGFDDREDVLNYLGYNSLPRKINLYFDSLEDKEIVLSKIDNRDHKLVYVDVGADSIRLVREFMQIVSGGLLLFSIISLFVSSIMILLMTNVRVIERKKEIGILRSLGAKRRDIKRLFSMENMMIGGIASLISILVVIILEKPINELMMKFLNIEGMFKINYGVMILIGIVNIFLVRLAGSIPSFRASKLEIVSCIYDR